VIPTNRKDLAALSKSVCYDNDWARMVAVPSRCRIWGRYMEKLAEYVAPVS
jgi:hypothetical protein